MSHRQCFSSIVLSGLLAFGACGGSTAQSGHPGSGGSDAGFDAPLDTKSGSGGSGGGATGAGGQGSPGTGGSGVGGRGGTMGSGGASGGHDGTTGIGGGGATGSGGAGAKAGSSGGGAGGGLGPCGSTDTSPRLLHSRSVTCTDGVSHVITEFGFPAGSAPGIIKAGPDGNLWFTERGVTGPTGHMWYGGGNIGRITPEGSITEFSISESGMPSRASDLTTGPDGNIWYTGEGNEVGRLSPSGELTKFPLPAGASGPSSIVTGPDKALWFSENRGIGRISLEGAITTFQLPISPGTLVSGNDGNLWFTEDHGIGRMSSDGTLTSFALPTADAIPSGLVVGPEGGLWLGERRLVVSDGGGLAPGNPTIGRVDYSGVITESTIPVTTLEGVSLWAGSDGNLWFKGEDYYTLIGRLSPTGEITVCTMAGYSVSSIALGPDGNVWIMDTGGCSIDRFSL